MVIFKRMPFFQHNFDESHKFEASFLVVHLVLLACSVFMQYHVVDVLLGIVVSTKGAVDDAKC